MKVYMQYPLGISDSQYYKSMIDNPPKNVRYINPTKKIGMIYNEKSFLIINYLKNTARNLLSKSGMVLPNAHTSPDGDYDLIHCAHCLSKNDSPHVIDVESVWQLWISGRDSDKGRREVLRYLGSDNCKKIIAWTEETKSDIIKTFPEIAYKVEVVSYAMEAPKQSKKKKAKDITLFFSGRHFYSKGGLHATEAMDRLTKKYPNVKGIINGVIPKEVEERYSSNKKLKFYGLMPYKDILKIYRDSDIFIYPGYSDSFGFCLIEAMAFGLHTITVDGYARKEIVGGAGFVIERPAKFDIKKIEEKIIEDIVYFASSLIESEMLLEPLGELCKLKVSKGEFSIKNRNDKLSRIYEDALGLNTRVDLE